MRNNEAVMSRFNIFVLGILFVLCPSILYANQVFNISGSNGYLIGGDGTTGNSFRYDGSGIWKGPGDASIVVNEESNTGMVTGSIKAKGHTYKIVLEHFGAEKPFMDGGIARDLYLHGTTGNGPPVLPKIWTFLAGWGHANIFKDGKPLHKGAHAHFMLTHGTRDKTTHKVNYPGPKRLMMAKKSGDQARISAAVKEIKDAEQLIDTHTMQLHIVAHSDKKNPKHFPPFEWFLHFMWDDITWH